MQPRGSSVIARQLKGTLKVVRFLIEFWCITTRLCFHQCTCLDWICGTPLVTKVGDGEGQKTLLVGWLNSPSTTGTKYSGGFCIPASLVIPEGVKLLSLAE
eukprot:TRINITY_DN35519_c0_g2_i1.p1 TRINITY_DN35519_c0_g2~~TRINITY_DN35519_c0_g2_i1.p1  ORF type:complete len:101 (-),score=1.58 TRINITY_DN35519_c0_g2_i1:69-371(-)